jgi:hypothetical protein
MGAFHEVRLPARLAFGSTGGVERRTEITTLASPAGEGDDFEEA